MADIFVAKFLDDATCSWTAHFEGVDPASIGKGFSIALNPDETFVFTSGVFTGTIDFDPGADTEHRTSAPGSVDMYISLLTSSTGDYVSVYQMQGYNGNGGFDPDLVNSIIVDDNGCFTPQEDLLEPLTLTQTPAWIICSQLMAQRMLLCKNSAVAVRISPTSLGWLHKVLLQSLTNKPAK